MPLRPLKAHSGGEQRLEIIDPLCAVFRRKLKSEGLKYTPERAQVLDTVIRLGESNGNGSGLIEADRVLFDVTRSGFRVSKATVYRTIRLLQEAGIIERVPFDDDQSHYQLAYGATPRDAIVRMDTGETVPIEVPELVSLREAICQRMGLKARGHRLHIFAVRGD